MLRWPTERAALAIAPQCVVGTKREGCAQEGHREAGLASRMWAGTMAGARMQGAARCGMWCLTDQEVSACKLYCRALVPQNVGFAPHATPFLSVWRVPADESKGCFNILNDRYLIRTRCARQCLSSGYGESGSVPVTVCHAAGCVRQVVCVGWRSLVGKKKNQYHH